MGRTPEPKAVEPTRMTARRAQENALDLLLEADALPPRHSLRATFIAEAQVWATLALSLTQVGPMGFRAVEGALGSPVASGVAPGPSEAARSVQLQQEALARTTAGRRMREAH